MLIDKMEVSPTAERSVLYTAVPAIAPPVMPDSGVNGTETTSACATTAKAPIASAHGRTVTVLRHIRISLASLVVTDYRAIS
jgi:hypothetical protein